MGGAPADKPARLVAPGDAVVVAPAEAIWASRGGFKLDAALTRWQIVVEGRRCLDAGASTGGFTDVLLSRGATEVWAVDVGRGQLLERLRRDPRVVAMDRTNIRLCGAADLGGGEFEVVVADLSFISLRTVAPVLAGELAAPGSELVWLVKPQFEAGREIITEGTSGVGFFVIEAGTATVSVGGAEVRTLGPGDHFGEVALVGIQTRGVPLAQRLARLIEDRAGEAPELGAVDITFYRDDLSMLGPKPAADPQVDLGAGRQPLRDPFGHGERGPDLLDGLAQAPLEDQVVALGGLADVAHAVVDHGGQPASFG